MSQIVAIALGGSIGAVLRHLLSHQMYLRYGRDFPIGTFSVNIIGSFLMGFLGILLVEKMQVSVEIKTFFLVGLLGAFTTFSTFSLDAMALIQKGQNLKALVYMGSSVITCVFACWVGLIIAKQLFSSYP
jgi:CrcB protein